MAGLVAVIGSGTAVASELSRLSGAYQWLRGEHETARLCAGAHGALAVLAGQHEPRCVVEHRGTAWSAHLGTVHAPEGPLAAPISRLDGQFAMVRYEPETGRLEAITDPFGMQALYLARRGELTYLSS